MLQETPAQPDGIEGSRGGPDAGPSGASPGGGNNGIPPLEATATALGHNGEGEHQEANASPALREGENGEEPGGLFARGEHPAGAEHQEPDPRSQKRYSKTDFRLAVVGGAGDRQKIARALNISQQAVARRIAADPELCAIYGRGVVDAVSDPITALDLETYRAALKVYGVSAMHLEKQRALDALAAGNSDRMLAISLRVAHQSYVGLLHDLDEVAAAVKERLNGVAMPDGTTVAHEPEQHAALAKVFVDCVKERGRGAAIMMAGIETIVKMSAAAKDDAPDGAGKAKPGWGKMKKVRPPQNPTPPDAEV